MPLAAGCMLSHFEILGPLGAGGMGEVWRARDTRLRREVAIKVLPEELACDGVHLSRFEREARTLAALNHPNVAQVFDIDRVASTCFIAMELVPGEDLASRLSSGPLPIGEALDVCRQIAEGLENAHEAGIVHRDLKPGNVVLTPEGRAKVLDFGLAKLAGPAAKEMAAPDSLRTTAPGHVLGTPTYMAPEQVRGKPIDRRVDVWAFGCVLYECLIGVSAFGGESLGDVLSAVLGREPDLSRLPRATPARVRRLLGRCLDKDPRTRLRDIGEARIALSVGGGTEETTSDGPGRVRWWPVLLALAAGGAAASVASFALWPQMEPRSPLQSATFSRLTDVEASEFDVDVSPNGDFIAYGAERGSTIDVWVQQIEGGAPQNLTQGRYTVLDDPIRNVGFTAQGTHVWFMSGVGDRIVAAPKTGGDFDLLVGPGVASVGWTRDGTRLVYHVNAPGDPLYVRDADAPPGDPILVGDAGVHQHFPVWSFDEEWILFARGIGLTRDMHLWRVRPDGSDAEQLTFEQKDVAFPAPLDDDTVLFVAEDADGSGPWLWSLDLPTRSVCRAAVGTEHYTSLAVTADGRRAVATVSNPHAALWRVPILERTAREDDAALLPGVRSPFAVAPRYASGDLFYLSSRGAGLGLWRLRGDRAREIWSGAKEPLVFPPSISPDGKLAAVLRRRGARMVLSLVSVESGQTVRLFDGPADLHGGSSWSPSGEWIVVGGSGPDGPGLFKFPRDGGPAELVASGRAMDPFWSPTEDLIVYGGKQTGPLLPLLAVRSDGTPVQLAPEVVEVRLQRQAVRFLPDGSGFVFLSGSAIAPDFWLLDIATGRTRRLTELDPRGSIQTFDVTPDGSAIVFDRSQENSDIVLIDLPERR